MKRKSTKYIVVHCSATRPMQDIGVKEIKRWHLERKFKDIGYHFVIRRGGILERGRDLDDVGAHVAGYNHCSIGICLVGGLNERSRPVDNFTEKQMETLSSLLDTLQDIYPEAMVLGHRDFHNVAKACPCFDVGAWQKQKQKEMVNV